MDYEAYKTFDENINRIANNTNKINSNMNRVIEEIIDRIINTNHMVGEISDDLKKMNLIQAQRNEIMKLNMGIPKEYINMDLINRIINIEE